MLTIQPVEKGQLIFERHLVFPRVQLVQNDAESRETGTALLRLQGLQRKLA